MKRNMLKKALALLTALCLLGTSSLALAENGGTPPEKPDGQEQSGDRPEGTPPDGFGGGNGGPGGDRPDSKPDGQPGNPPDGNGGPGGNPPDGNGGPGGGSGQPDSYDAVYTFSEDAELTDEDITSTGKDENAVLVSGGSTTVTGGSITRSSSDSTGGDNASFYGVGAAALVTGGTLTVSGATITTDSAGGAGVFAYGDGVAYVTDCTISTEGNTAGGIHVAGGGTLYAENLTVVTQGESSAAIRSDRGSGTMVVTGGSYTSNGLGSPAVYVTADITVSDATLTATGSEALCLEGLNTVTLNSCTLTGSMKDLDQNDNTWTVILYQSMSGDAQVGQGSFTMNGGTLVSLNGGLFYTTNTESVFTLNNVELVAQDDCEYLLRCTGNSNQRGWGTSGKNGADCVFTAIAQVMNGTVIWDSISTLQLSLTEGTVYTGAIVDDESCAGEGGSGSCAVTVDETSTWIVTGDSYVTSLDNQGTVTDAEGNSVTVANADGTVITQGTSAWTIYLMSL